MTDTHTQHAGKDASRQNTGTHDTLYYDGGCGLCLRSVGWLRRLDWLHRLRFVDSTSVSEDELPVTLSEAMEAIPMRTREGVTLVGFFALRRALRHTPLGLPIAMFLHLPGAVWVGPRVYHWIASHRKRSCSCAASRTSSASDDLNAQQPGHASGPSSKPPASC